MLISRMCLLLTGSLALTGRIDENITWAPLHRSCVQSHVVAFDPLMVAPGSIISAQMDACLPCRRESSTTTTTCCFLLAAVASILPLAMVAQFDLSCHSRASYLLSSWTATGSEEECYLLPEMTKLSASTFWGISAFSVFQSLLWLSLFHDAGTLSVHRVEEGLMLTDASELFHVLLQLPLSDSC